jgi:hypothetical protein
MVDYEDLETEGVAPSIADWTFEQVVSSYQKPEKDATIYLKSAGINDGACGKLLSTVFEDMSQQTGYPFSLLVSASLLHGVSIVETTYGDIITAISAIRINAMNTQNKMMFKRIYAHVISVDGFTNYNRLNIKTDEDTAARIGKILSCINCKKQTLITICILYSMSQSDLVPTFIKNEFVCHRIDFETHINDIMRLIR